MKSVKKLIFTALTFFSINSFAGGSGGGGILMDAMSLKNPEAVFKLGQSQDNIQFAYGQFVNKIWKVRKIDLPKAVIIKNDPVYSALIQSEDVHDWAFVEAK